MMLVFTACSECHYRLLAPPQKKKDFLSHPIPSYPILSHVCTIPLTTARRVIPCATETCTPVVCTLLRPLYPSGVYTATPPDTCTHLHPHVHTLTHVYIHATIHTTHPHTHNPLVKQLFYNTSGVTSHTLVLTWEFTNLTPITNCVQTLNTYSMHRNTEVLSNTIFPQYRHKWKMSCCKTCFQNQSTTHNMGMGMGMWTECEVIGLKFQNSTITMISHKNKPIISDSYSIRILQSNIFHFMYTFSTW